MRIFCVCVLYHLLLSSAFTQLVIDCIFHYCFISLDEHAFSCSMSIIDSFVIHKSFCRICYASFAFCGFFDASQESLIMVQAHLSDSLTLDSVKLKLCSTSVSPLDSSQDSVEINVSDLFTQHRTT